MFILSHPCWRERMSHRLPPPQGCPLPHVPGHGGRIPSNHELPKILLPLHCTCSRIIHKNNNNSKYEPFQVRGKQSYITCKKERKAKEKCADSANLAPDIQGNFVQTSMWSGALPLSWGSRRLLGRQVSNSQFTGQENPASLQSSSTKKVAHYPAASFQQCRK